MAVVGNDGAVPGHSSRSRTTRRPARVAGIWLPLTATTSRRLPVRSAGR